MEKKPRRVIIHLTPIICFLLLILLYYVDLYGSKAAPFYQRVQQDYSWQLSSVEDAESSEVQEAKPLSIGGTEVDETLLQDPDSGEVSHNSSNLNETIEVQESKPSSLDSRVVDETTLQEHKSRQISLFNQTIEVQDSRPQSLGSRIVDETLQEHESRQASSSSREFKERIEVKKSKPQRFGSIGTEGTLQESGKADQNSRESNETVRREEEKFSRLTKSSRELNETVEERRAEQLSFSKEGVNGTMELQESKQLIREVHEAIGGQESRQPSLINREGKNMIKEQDSRESLFTRLVRGEDRTKLEATGFACDTAIHSVVCVTKKPATIDMATMTVHIPADQTVEPNHTVVRPYARQEDEDVLRNVRPVQIFHANTAPPACQYNHDVPAVIFSSSGFTGNLFHEFNEIIIPLFITTYHFQSHVQFILVDYKPTFANKYKRLMSRLSSYEVMNPAANPSVHCFSGAVAGLKFHDNLALNSSDIPGGYTMHSFRQFLRQIYSLKIINVSEIKRPKLMLISRRSTRRLVNEAQMVRMMKDLGFEVIVATKPDRMSNLNKFARVVNSCSVLVGTHGAGLANELFLPDGAVMVQIEPLGLDWASAFYYGNPAEAMGVHYLRYKIEPDESTLLGIYGRTHPAITDPGSIFARGYQPFRAVYLDQQNMKVNLVRFRETLLEALRLTGFSTSQKQ